MSRDRDHPLWDVYDEWRTARLNVKYYSARIEGVRRKNTIIEWVIAASASGALASAWIFQNDVGFVAWNLLAVCAAALAVAKPLLHYADRMTSYEQLITGYRALDHDMGTLHAEVRLRGAYDELAQYKFQEARKRRLELVKSAPAEKSDRRLVAALQQEVNQELPSSFFYFPGPSPVESPTS